MRLVISILLFLHFSSNNVLAQIDSTGRFFPEWHNYFSIDTLTFKSKKIKVVYTLERTNNLKDKFFKQGNLIFNDSLNKTSKLYIINEHYLTDSLSTIPIDNVIIDDSKELILCLSRAEVSPYHIVLYNFKGELLFKKRISLFELELDSIGYKQFKDSFSDFYEYAVRQKQILNINGIYYIDLDYWHNLSKQEIEKIKQAGWIKTARYFKVYPESFDGTLPIELSKYTNFYSQTDPFYEFEIKEGKLIGIILNDEYGGKVKIPTLLN